MDEKVEFILKKGWANVPKDQVGEILEKIWSINESIELEVSKWSYDLRTISKKEEK